MSTIEAISYPRPLTRDGQPDPDLAELAREHPVLRVMGPGGPAWLVTGQDAVREVLADPERFTSVVDPTVTDARARAGVSMVGMDPPEHTRLRRLAAQPFTARRIRAMVPDVERVTAELIDDMQRSGPPVDLVSALAIPLPLRVMCHMLRLPPQDQPDFLSWSEVFTGMSNFSGEEIAEATGRLHTYMRELAAQRRENLGEDVLSNLIRARDGQDAMTEDELLSTMVLLLVAGHQTTVRAIARGVLILLVSGQWRRLVDGEVSVEKVVEEVLRHQTPTDTGLFRRAAVDTDLAGVRISANDQVFLSVQLANLDPQLWSQPHVFDPDRPEQGHLAFGHGVHFCLGAPLARVELQIAFGALADRLPGLRLDSELDELTWTEKSWLNAPVEVPVTW
jgi:nocardicin N-oxygenase